MDLYLLILILFLTRFADKTKNIWANRKAFKHSVGKYDLLAMDYGENSSKVS